MARKDEIFTSFLHHELLKEKYKISKESLGLDVKEGLNAKEPIVQAIAMIVERLEKKPRATDAVIRDAITQFLRYNAI